MGLFDLFRTKPAAAVAPPRSVPRFPVDRARMFDLAQTARLEALFRTPQDQRDDLWQGAFYDAAWNASLVVAPAHFSGPDGLPYFRLDIPYPKASFESQPLGNLARSFVERGAGVAIFSSPEDAEDEAQFVLPMGLLDSLLRFDSPGGFRSQLGSRWLPNPYL